MEVKQQVAFHVDFHTGQDMLKREIKQKVLLTLCLWHGRQHRTAAAAALYALDYTQRPGEEEWTAKEPEKY